MKAVSFDSGLRRTVCKSLLASGQSGGGKATRTQRADVFSLFSVSWVLTYLADQVAGVAKLCSFAELRIVHCIRVARVIADLSRNGPVHGDADRKTKTSSATDQR